MKRYGIVAAFALVALLLVLAPQLRGDCTDHFNYGEHTNTLFATSNDKDSNNGHSWWAGHDDWHHHWHLWDSGSGNGNSGGSNGDCGSGADSQSGSGATTDASAPEPSTLALLLSSFLAAGLGLALKKAG